MPTTTLTTDRLLIRPPRLDDAEAIFERYAQDPEVTRYLIWRPHRSLDETRTFLGGYIAQGEDEHQYSWVTVRRADELLLGTITLRVYPPTTEVGYTVAKPDWGRGYGTEALRAVVHFGLALPDVFRIQATCHVDNHASARIMDKVGMEREGTLRRYLYFPTIGPEAQDVHMYARVQDAVGQGGPGRRGPQGGDREV